ncbi:hypothetical protein [Saccharospirillum impatiens]|uniref:hypothetical protein n=1 Tax=Saccharospirillum impatiens TaxID=169438 RepID=UPI00040A06E8|nr:hypothetical protein [Saccharospirillum impatiens]
MKPRQVTLTQLFLQPRVHRVWMLKHGSLWFDLPVPICEQFDALWRRYCEACKPSPAEFLVQEHLVENDALFALFASAVFLDRTLSAFTHETTESGLCWQFDSGKV